MTSLTKLRNTLTLFIGHSPLRWVVLSLVSAPVIGTTSYSYRKIDSELTTVALLRREAKRAGKNAYRISEHTGLSAVAQSA